MASAVFVLVAAPRIKSSLWSKSSRNLGSMAKISLYALSTLKKHMTEFLGTNFGKFCGSMALMVNCYALLSHSTAERKIVFWWMSSNHSRSMWAFDSGKGMFWHLSLSLFAWIGSTNAAKLMSVPRLKIAKSVVCYLLMIWFRSLSQNLPSSAH